MNKSIEPCIVSININVSSECYTSLIECAKQTKKSMSTIVNIAINKYLDELSSI